MTNLFATLVPVPAAAYCQQLHQTYGFTFQLARSRRSRLGDFRVWADGRTQITVNSDLSPWRFLITYVHEVAHAHVNRHIRRPTAPHGPAWQQAFRQLMQPMLTDTVFPPAVLEPLRQYLQKPAATTHSDTTLILALRQLDVASEPSPAGTGTMLRDMAEGTLFTLNKKKYVRGTLRRTRVVCKELASGKSYTVVAHALVELA